MEIELLDTVVLKQGLPSYGLKKGDIGAVVEIYDPDGIEVEFVTGSGRTQALVTLKVDQVRSVGPTDILAVRDISPSLGHTAGIGTG